MKYYHFEPGLALITYVYFTDVHASVKFYGIFVFDHIGVFCGPLIFDQHNFIIFIG